MKSSWISLGLWMMLLDRSIPRGVVVMLLDCCRANSSSPLFKAKSTRQRLQRGLGERLVATPLTNSVGFIIGFAADPGTVALERAGGTHGIFTGALLDMFRKYGHTVPLPLVLAMVRNRIRDEVVEPALPSNAARHGQRPWDHCCHIGHVFLFEVGYSSHVAMYFIRMVHAMNICERFAAG